MHAVATLLAVALPLAAAAQVAPSPPPETSVAPPTAIVVGRVMDSLVTGRPLAGAEIWLDGAPSGAVSDSTGRFRIERLEPGRHSLGFIHPALDTLGVAAPVVHAQVGLLGETRVDLATPSALTFHRRVCGAPPGEGEGVLVGVVQDAAGGQPVAGATVTAAWLEWTVARAGLQRVQRSSRVTADAAGRFTMCFVPADVVVEAGAAAEARASGIVDVVLGARAFAVQHITVGAPGAAVLTGVVRDTVGGTVRNARVAVAGTALAATTDSAGAFRIGGVVAGSQTLEVRALGFSPARVRVVARAGAPTDVPVTVGRAQVLPTVAVVDRARKPLDISGFEERRRGGPGYFLTQEEIERRQPFVPTDVLRTIPGIRIQQMPDGKKYLVIPRGGAGAGCNPAVYLDGMIMGGGATELDDWVRAQEIRAVEVYASFATVPQEYRVANSTCGVVLIWTRVTSR